MLMRLTCLSLLSRKITVGLTVLSIALSVTLFLGVEKLRLGARSSFSDTISGTDLLVGARSGSVQLLLYAVFRIGNATNNMTWDSYRDIASRPEVDWAVPISLGDSHRQFRVMGTTAAFFERYKYRKGRGLEFAQGTPFEDLYDAVIGADVAKTLGYELGDEIVIAHGINSFSRHDDQPFRVAGVLAKTGTPVDRTVIVSLEGIEAIHVDWQSGARRPGKTTAPEDIRQMELTPKAITAAMIGVKSRIKVFGLQRAINDYPEEPLQAVLPGVALQELWQIVGVAETALLGVSVMVVVTALIGLMAMIFSGLNERRREMAILRAIGARPRMIIGLLVLEGCLIALAGVVFGVGFLYGGLMALQPWLDSTYGIWVPITPPSLRDLYILGAVVGAAVCASLLPAFRAYKLSLADGMMVKT